MRDAAPLIQDIQAQPLSLSGILDYQTSAGRRALEDAGGLLRSCGSIVITGMGASLFASVPLEYYLSEHGIRAVVIEAAELLHYRQAPCEDTAILIVSRSGDSIEIAKLVSALRGRIPIVGLTNEPRSTLARQADCCLQLQSPPDQMVAVQTYTGTVLTLALLGAAITSRFTTVCDQAQSVLATLPELIATSFEGMHSWDGFLTEGFPTYLIGRGPSFASVQEGVLLFHEVARAPAVGILAGSFRHGPVELVSDFFRGVILAPHGRTRDLNLALARDILRFGGQVRAIGPAEEHVDGLFVCETPCVPEMLAPLVEIVPIQIACLRLAELRGVKIGEFRYTPLVTRDEATFGTL